MGCRFSATGLRPSTTLYGLAGWPFVVLHSSSVQLAASDRPRPRLRREAAEADGDGDRRGGSRRIETSSGRDPAVIRPIPEPATPIQTRPEALTVRFWKRFR
jgi:hypothetical protein